MNTRASELSTKKLLVRMGLRVLIIISVLVFIRIFFGTALRFLIPFLLAYLVSNFVLIPIIKKLSVRLRKVWAILFVILIMAVTILGIGAAGYYVVKQGYSFVKNWDEYRSGIEDGVKAVADFIGARTSIRSERIVETAETLGDRFTDWIRTDLPSRAPQYAGKVGVYLPSVGSFLLAFLFFLLATYFICSDFPNINSKLGSLIPEAVRPHLHQIKNSAGSAAFGYLRAQLILSSIVALIAFIVFVFMNQSYSILFALFVGIVDFIPMLGSAVVLVPWALLLIVTGNYMKAVVYAVLCFVLFMFRRITEPKIVGDQTGLHPLLSLICLYIGIKVGGIIGMIMAPIICMMLIGLYSVGFFKPTYDDLAELLHRMAVYSEMNKNGEDGGEE